MFELINAVLTSIILIPGFLCVYLPYKIFSIKIKYSNLELTLLSLIISIIIFYFTLVSYQILHYIIPSIFDYSLKISEITISKLIENTGFSFLFLLYILIFIFIGIFFISKDRLRNIRKRLTGIDVIISSEDYVMSSALKEHASKTNGYVIVETINDELFFGFIQQWAKDEKDYELLLKYPQKYDDENDNYTKIDGIDSIIFMKNDIRRIYLATSNNKNE